MRRMRVALIAVALLGSIAPVTAAWRVTDGLDIATGKPSRLLIGELDPQTSLYARCIDGVPELFLDQFDGADDPAYPGNYSLTIANDQGASRSSPARHARDRSAYVTTTWLETGSIAAVAQDLAAASAAISIVITEQSSGNVRVWETDAVGSTAAARRFLEVCPGGVGGNTPTPQQGPAPSQPPMAWPSRTTPGT